jgi:hypothetical protein
MIAARRLMTVYLLEELTQTSAPRVSESRRGALPLLVFPCTLMSSPG